MNPDIIYYNCNLITQKLSPTDEDQVCRYEENRPDPIVKNASDYQFSLIRASIDSSNIPCFIPKIVPGGNVNMTSYLVSMGLTLNLNGTITTGQSTQPLIYVCRNKYVNQVPSVAGTDSPYYYMFDLQDFCDMFNTTMKSIFANINFGIAPTVLKTKPPKMTYQNNLFSIWYDSTGWGGVDSTGVAPHIESFTMHFNDDLRLLLRNFNMNYKKIINYSKNFNL